MGGWVLVREKDYGIWGSVLGSPSLYFGEAVTVLAKGALHVTPGEDDDQRTPPLKTLTAVRSRRCQGRATYSSSFALPVQLAFPFRVV